MSLNQLTEFSLKTKKADSFSTVETSNSDNVESKKIKRVSFGRVEIVKIQKYKKYNKLPPQYEEHTIDIDTKRKRQKNEITCNQCIIF